MTPLHQMASLALAAAACLLAPTHATSTPLEPAQQAYQQAQEALAQQQWTQAELWLERTLMYQPEHAEALLQLALLLAQRGQQGSAQSLINALLQDPRTPPAHRQRLQALLLPALPQAPAPAQPHGQASITLGRNSNPLGAPQVSAITLTLPSGNLSIPLETRATPAYQSTLAWQQQWPSGAYLGASATHSDALSTQSAWSLGAALPLPATTLTPDAAAPVLLQIGASRGLDGSGRQTLSLQGPLGTLQWRLGTYREPEALRQGWHGGLQHHSSHLQDALQARLWLGYEHARAPASPAWRSSLALQAQLAPQVSAQWITQMQLDTRAYSPLLAQGAPRQQLTSALSLNRTWPMANGGAWQAGLLAQRRWSNLPLFAWKELALNFGYTQTW